MAPLDGTRVIELSTMITAPLAGMMLADMGAEVIKVERPEGGDPFRAFRGGDYSPHFCAYNRNKRSVTLDLRSEFGVQALERLLASADVLIDNFRPGVLDRLGFSDERLVDMNDRLVRCSITGFGASGPYVERPAYDAVAQALSGMSSLFLTPENPRITGPTIADNVTGMYAAYGVLSALLERQRTGKGRRVEVNMLEASIAFIPDPYSYLTQMGLVSDAYLRARTSQSYAFVCSDDRMVCVHLSSQEKFWQGFLQVIERQDLADDPRFSSRMGRIDNYGALIDEAASEFVKRPLSHWEQRLWEHDVPFAPVRTIPEVFSDPQVMHLDSFADLERDGEEPVRTIRSPVWLDQERRYQPLNRPPKLGEDTEEVLRELGLLETMDDSERSQLR